MVSADTLSRLMLAVPVILVLAAVLFIDLFPAPYGGYADQRFLLVVLCGLLAILPVGFYALRCSSAAFRLFGVLVPTALLCIGLLVLSLPYRGHSYVWVEPGMYVFFFLAAVTSGAWLSIAGSGESFVRALVLIVAASCALYGLATMNVYLFALMDRVTNLVDFIPWGFVNIRYWSHIATWCLPLMPLAVLVGPLKGNRLWRVGVLLSAGIWWWILILTTSRGSALGIAFGVVVVLLLFGRRALPWLKVFLVYLVAGVIIWALLSIVIPSLIAEDVQIRSIRTDSSGRMPLFIEAWAMSLQNFPFGMGPQSWLTHDVLTEAYSQSRHFGHPHNMYLMWAAEYGWVVVGLLGLVVAQAVRYFWIRRSEVLSENNSEQVFMLMGVTASVSAALFHGGVSAVFMAPGSMLVGLFVLVAFWALIIPKAVIGQQPADYRRSFGVWRAIAIIGCLVLITLWLLWMKEVWGYFEDMRLDEQTYSEEVGGGILPRFWFHGNFPRSP